MLLLLRILNKLRILSHLDLVVSRKINGVSFRIPLHGRTGLIFFYEKEVWMKVILKQLMPLVQHKTFVDVGVNLGQTLLIVKSTSRSIDYVGFEPNPHCVYYVDRLREVNSLDPVLVVPCALGKEDGVITLFRTVADSTDSSATIVKEFRDTQDKRQILVPVISSKNLPVLRDRTAGIIKIDVEGAELEVLTALEDIIFRDNPFIICEILPVYKSENQFRLARQQQVESLLTRAGYKSFRISDKGALTPVASIGVHDKLEDSNYLFIPQQQLGNLKLA